ncbi:MAG TPA: type II and III secretion system protein [Bryobacteraceae bacterium]|nr:type II and III secretion system protein [Bryobacteraceae bacterium]
MLCLLVSAPVLADEPSAWDLYEQGRAAEKAGHIAQAYLFYAEAAAMDPKNTTYWQHSQAIRTRAALEGLAMPDSKGSADAEPEPKPEYFKPEDATARDLWDAARVTSPPELAPDDGTGDIDLHGDSKQVWGDLAKIFGLECTFDTDYEPMPTLRFRLRSVNFDVAMQGLQAATGTFVVPLTNKMFLVVKDTPQKRTERQPRVAVAIPLPDSVTQQDFNQAVTAVQQAVGLEKVAFDTQTKTVILRDTLAKVTAARGLFKDLVRPPAQVMVQLKLLEVTRNDMVTYGVDFPNVFSLSMLTNWFNNLATPPTSISGLLEFGGGKTLIGLGVMNAALVAQMSKSSSSNLLDSALRTTDGIAATLHIGQQYPVMTSQYEGPASFTQGGTAYTPPPSFQFVDLGLTLKVTPAIRSRELATLDVDAEYKILTGDSVNGIPVIGNRALKSNVTLQMGQWAVVGGLLDAEQAHTIAGLAGASRIPGLSALTSVRTKTKSEDMILLVIRPVLLSLPAAEVDPGRAYRMGSETRPLTLL